jgi:hypothetical protein
VIEHRGKKDFQLLGKTVTAAYILTGLMICVIVLFLYLMRPLFYDMYAVP